MTGDRPAPSAASQPPAGIGRWIRWPGVIAFAVVTALLAAAWWLLVDGMVERAIERAGTQAVGARVELAAAHLTLVPLGLTLSGLEVTDPETPMTNAVEVKRISFLMDGLNLLRRKVIVNEMTVDGVRFGTPRKTFGAIGRQEPGIIQKVAKTKFVLPSAQIPDVKEILAKEELQSMKLAETLRADIQAEQDRWKQQMAGLPSKAKFDEYKQRLDKVKSAGKGGVGSIISGTSGWSPSRRISHGTSSRSRRPRKVLRRTSPNCASDWTRRRRRRRKTCAACATSTRSRRRVSPT